MSRKLFYFSLLSLSITACSGVNNKQAMGGFEYAKQPEAKSLAVPEGLEQPKKHNDFYVENDINHNGPIGGKVDIRAPSLVLPIAASSRVEQESADAKIWFDKVLEDKDLQLFIYEAVEKQLTVDGVNLNVVDAEQKVFESEWLHNTTDSGWLFTDEKTSKSMRFQFSFESKPHGRSVALIVNLVEYKAADGSTSMDVIDKHRAEMAMLNQIISQVDYQYRLQQRENRLMRANQQLVSIGENAEAEPAYIVEMELDPLWSNMPIFFEDYGFSITDLNESKKIYYVDFVKPDSGFWDRIWGDDVPVIDVKESSYQFVLAKIDEQTSVTIYDAEGNALSRDTLEKIMPVMDPGLSFRNVL
jgi:outer membrane protein assembly factor BamC